MKNVALTYGQAVFFVFMLFFFSSCRKSLQNEKLVYDNNFESGDVANSEGLKFSPFNGSRVAGNYHNEGLTISLASLQGHDYVKISFDLNIHDYWDGNSAGNSEVTVGPDIWWMKLDEQDIIYTTFSNTVCNEVYCLLQSYPKNYPFHYDPRHSVTVTDLPGFCSGGITSTYHVEKLVKHDRSSLKLEFGDLLQQTNVPDPKCDESWSMDNLRISTLSMN